MIDAAADVELAFQTTPRIRPTTLAPTSFDSRQTWKSSDDVIPEYFATGTRMRDGAEMWEVLDDGTQRLVAVLRGGAWTPKGNAP